MSRLHSPALLLLLFLSVFVYSASAASCHIPKAWSTNVVGRSDRYVPAILPAPYCQLLSYSWVNGTSYHYALRVRDGSVAWQWPRAPIGDMTQAVQLRPSSSPDRVYALVSWERDVMRVNSSVCSLLAALHSSDGSVIWAYELCFPEAAGVGPAFTVLQSAHSNSTDGERIVLTIGSSALDLGTDYMLAHVLNATTGRLLSTANLTNLVDWTIQPVGKGEDGYFTIDLLTNATTQRGLPQLFQLTADNRVTNISSTSVALLHAVLQSQPALRLDDPKYPTQLEAHDVASDALVWANEDSFLIGTDWGTNETFTHYSTSYQLSDTTPSLFIVLNTAYHKIDNNNQTVIAQVGIYQLSSGKQVSLSPLLSFDHLYHPDANPTTWQFGDILLLRGDTVWYTLQLPSLEVVKQGQYATSDASLRSNNWLVDPDGSYVALLYGDTDEVRGYPPSMSDKVELARAHPAETQHRHVKRG